MTHVYVYRLTSDTGLAPCTEKGLLSLAVCKGGQIRGQEIIHTGLRFWIGSKKDADYSKEKVYLLGTYKNRFLYLARVTGVITMQEYFDGMSKGRMDNIYSVRNGKLVRNAHLAAEKIHTDPDRMIRDFAGEYVLLSDDYIYLGQNAVFNEFVDKYNAKGREVKRYDGAVADKLVEECRKYADSKVHMPNTPFQKAKGCKGGCI